MSNSNSNSLRLTDSSDTIAPTRIRLTRSKTKAKAKTKTKPKSKKRRRDADFDLHPPQQQQPAATSTLPESRRTRIPNPNYTFDLSSSDDEPSEKKRRLDEETEYLKDINSIGDISTLRSITATTSSSNGPTKPLPCRMEYLPRDIDKILHRRIGSDGIAQVYVLFKNASYLHCQWIDQASLGSAAKLRNFLRQNRPVWDESEGNKIKRDLFDLSLIEVDRVLACRPGPGFPKEMDEKGDDKNDGRFEYLVKFAGSNYSDSRWEFPEDIANDDAIRAFQERNVIPEAKLKVSRRPRRSAWTQLTESPTYRNDNKLHAWQIEGVNWLTFNWYQDRGCILADEMGLGKTVQIVCTCEHIARVYSRGPFLIIAPLTTIAHWKREFESWTDLNVIVYQGGKEDRRLCHCFEFAYWDESGRRMKDVLKFDVMICTYESVMLDDELLSNIDWKVCVVDEGHRLKNRSSKLARYLRERVRMEYRVLLTGTPIQNNVNELWSLLNFVDGKRFANESDFMMTYGDIADHLQVEKLQGEIRPYLLRRLKEQVAKFIPSKKETVIFVELTAVQKQYYKALLDRNRSFLMHGESKRKKNYPNLMNVVMQLRKICCHPYLLEGVEERIIAQRNLTDANAIGQAMISNGGKLVLLDKLLPKLRANGDKVLIFSQLKLLLNILQDYAVFRGYPVERIDGSVLGNARQAAIDRFCTDDNAFLFLLSTRAGGVGINLTSANTVIIFDSDWNPQNDIQAMARCHRIGQDQAVTIYRLITSNSYEEQMFCRASRKLGLGRAIMGGVENADASFIEDSKSSSNLNGPDPNEIDSLLKHGAYNLFNEDDDSAAERFAAQSIDEILSNAKTIDFDKGKTGDSDEDGDIEMTGNNANASSNSLAMNFSQATFEANDDASGINLHDDDFWEKVLPKELTASEMLANIESGTGLETVIGRDKAMEDLHRLSNDMMRRMNISLGIPSDEMEEERMVLIDLASRVADNSGGFFSPSQCEIARSLAQLLENPFERRRRRTTDVHQSSDEEMEDVTEESTTQSTSVDMTPIRSRRRESRGRTNSKKKSRKMKVPARTTNALGTFVFGRWEIEKILKAFWKGFSKCDGRRDLWDRVQAGSRTKRTLREICAWVIAFLGARDDIEDGDFFGDVKHVVEDLIPNEFEDDDCESANDSGDDYKPTSRIVMELDPHMATLDWFPSLTESFLDEYVSKKKEKWMSIHSVSLLMHQVLGDMKSIPSELVFEVDDPNGGNGKVSPFPRNEKLMGNPFWSCDDDRDLMLGCMQWGVNNWRCIRLDPIFGFMVKCQEHFRKEDHMDVIASSVIPQPLPTSSPMDVDEDGKERDRNDKHHRDDDGDESESPFEDEDDPSNHRNYLKECGMSSRKTWNVGYEFNVGNIESGIGYRCCHGCDTDVFKIACVECDHEFHGACVGYFHMNDVPTDWKCFKCNGVWPSDDVLLERMRQMMTYFRSKQDWIPRKPRLSGFESSIVSELKSNGGLAGIASSSSGKKNGNGDIEEMDDADHERARVMKEYERTIFWSHKEKRAFAQFVQQFGRCEWSEMKEKMGLTNKSVEQIESYFYSLMRVCEYHMKCDDARKEYRAGNLDYKTIAEEEDEGKERERKQAEVEMYQQQQMKNHMKENGVPEGVPMDLDDSDTGAPPLPPSSTSASASVSVSVSVSAKRRAVSNPPRPLGLASSADSSVFSASSAPPPPPFDDGNSNNNEPIPLVDAVMADLKRKERMKKKKTKSKTPPIVNGLTEDQLPKEGETDELMASAKNKVRSLMNGITDAIASDDLVKNWFCGLSTDVFDCGAAINRLADTSELMSLSMILESLTTLISIGDRNVELCVETIDLSNDGGENNNDTTTTATTTTPKKQKHVRLLIERSLKKLKSCLKRLRNMKLRFKKKRVSKSNTTTSPSPAKAKTALRLKRKKYELTDADLTRLGLIHPEESKEAICEHNVSAKLAKKIWTRMEMWDILNGTIRDSHLSLLADGGDGLMKALIQAPKQYELCEEMPSWYEPMIHDAMVIRVITQCGLGNVKECMACDTLTSVVDGSQQEHIQFFEKFLADKKPLISRLIGIGNYLSQFFHQTITPTPTGLTEWKYEIKVNRARYEEMMNEWIIERERAAQAVLIANQESAVPIAFHTRSNISYASLELSALASANEKSLDASKKKVKVKRGSGSGKKKLTDAECQAAYDELEKNDDGSVKLPLRFKGADILSLGVIDASGPMCNKKYIYPRGFTSRRNHASYKTKDARVSYTSSIVRGVGNKAEFQVVASDDSANPILKPSPSTAWQTVVKLVNDQKGTRQTIAVSGPEQFGFAHPIVKKMIENLPNAKMCVAYWKNKKER